MLQKGILKMMFLTRIIVLATTPGILALVYEAAWLSQPSAAMQPDASRSTGAQAEKVGAGAANKKPWAGEPKAEWLNKKLLTFQRLPKANEVTSLQISGPINYTKARLTAASFPALLDSMKPVRADDKEFRWHLAPWHWMQFETSEGRFEAELFLGGLAFLKAPDGTTGLVTFVHPVVAPANGQGKKVKPTLPGGHAPLSKLAPTCKGALVATLLEIGTPELGPPGATNYPSRWKVEKVLRGTYPATAALSFRVQTIPETSRETPPVVGKTYILISYEDNANQVAVMLDAGDENLRKVHELLGR
jgi:hypothetical protein